MDTTASAIEWLQAQGERITMPRRFVIEALGQSHEHLTISDIQAHIRTHNHDHGMSDTTIYRVLQWLKSLGLVSQTDMGQGGTVYALMSRPYHHHLICLTCGASITINDTLFAPVREQLRRNYGFEARIDHMAIYGYCRECIARNSAPE